jgi:hypothetical protein
MHGTVQMPGLAGAALEAQKNNTTSTDGECGDKSRAMTLTALASSAAVLRLAAPALLAAPTPTLNGSGILIQNYFFFFF